MLSYCCTNNAHRSPVSAWEALSETATFYSDICIVLYTHHCSRLNCRTTSMRCRACCQQTHTTNLVNVNWTVTVIIKLRLPPKLLLTPRISTRVHRRWRGPTGRMDTNFRRYNAPEPETVRPVEKRNFYLPHAPAFGAPSGWFHRNFVEIFCVIKLEFLGYRAALSVWS